MKQKVLNMMIQFLSFLLIEMSYYNLEKIILIYGLEKENFNQQNYHLHIKHKHN